RFILPATHPSCLPYRNLKRKLFRNHLQSRLSLESRLQPHIVNIGQGVMIFCMAGASVWGAAPDALARAAKLYNQTDYESSLSLLSALSDKDGAVLDLIGKNHFMLGEFKKAGEYHEKAVAADPSNSEYEHWLGKDYGKRAETSSPFTAPGLASKARQ